ncbi:MAG TPA: hypothetical protein VHJ17_09535 [Thermomonospora sp.]|nr:hypothetical protein [Thermomonospora sp.]
MPKGDLTPEQKAVVEEAEAKAERILKDARSRLAEMGVAVEQGEPGDFSCSRCDCAAYTGTPLAPCRTPRCGHAFTLHNVF